MMPISAMMGQIRPRQHQGEQCADAADGSVDRIVMDG